MNKYMEAADKLAADNLITNCGGPFGAVIVKDGNIVGRGSNHVLPLPMPRSWQFVTPVRI